MRLCKSGEIISGINCEVCRPGKYSFEIMAEECKDCPLNANCTEGDQIYLDSGFWRMYLNSTNIYRCLKPSACLGGYRPDLEFPVECKEGYSSYLCATCEGVYARDGSFGCVKCPKKVPNIIWVIGLIFLFFLWTAILIFFNLRRKIG